MTAEGNLTAQTNTSTHVITSYTYDYRNRLTEVKVGGTIEATYTYDSLNRRVGVDDSGTQTWTVYDGTSADADPYADFNSSGSLTVRYLHGPGVVLGAVVDELLARTSSGGTTAWYLPDNLGSVRDIVSIAAVVQDHIVYDSFGNILTETNATNGDRFKFAGMQYDAAIGQYYDHARDYSSTTGGFLSQDPKGFAAGNPDLYGYVGNEPTCQTDTSGLQAGVDFEDPSRSLGPGDLVILSGNWPDVGKSNAPGYTGTSLQGFIDNSKPTSRGYALVYGINTIADLDEAIQGSSRNGKFRRIILISHAGGPDSGPALNLGRDRLTAGNINHSMSQRSPDGSSMSQVQRHSLGQTINRSLTKTGILVMSGCGYYYHADSKERIGQSSAYQKIWMNNLKIIAKSIGHCDFANTSQSQPDVLSGSVSSGVDTDHGQKDKIGVHSEGRPCNY